MRLIELVLREAKRIVRMERGVIVAETRHGFVCANAGVDASNVAEGTALLLPATRDRSTRELRERLGCGYIWKRNCGLIILLRHIRIMLPAVARREVLVNVAHRRRRESRRFWTIAGSAIRAGRLLSATVIAIADES